MYIREASANDAHNALVLIKRSICELCIADHENMKEKIADWLKNKTPENWARWVQSDNAAVFVAVDVDDALLGVSMITESGEVLLNYVSPDHRFHGVSSALLSVMEEYALSRGAASCTLESTITAQKFYLTRGYLPAGDEEGKTFKHLEPVGR